jgi:Tol biopolymer transport system component
VCPRTAAVALAVGLSVLWACGPFDFGTLSAARQTSPSEQFEHAVTLMESRGDYAAAAKLFEAVAGGSSRVLAARALVYLGMCYEHLGETRARTAYRRVIEQYADQPAALAQARTRLAALDRGNTGPVRRELTLRRLWNGPPLPDAELGRPSFDGRFLPIASTGGIALQDLRSGRLGPLVAIGGAPAGHPKCNPISLPVLSPHASAVVFNCQADEDRVEIRIASLRAGGVPEHSIFIAAAGDSVEPREWRRPDHILAQVTHADRTAEIILVPVSGAPARRIVALANEAEAVSLSPDGQWLAFDARDGGEPPRRDVLVVPANGGPPVTIEGGPTDDLFPMWTPDGRSLLFVSDRAGSSGLWLQAITAGRPVGAARLLTGDLGRIADLLGVTASGAFVYFRQTGMVDVEVVDLDSDGNLAGEPSAAGTRYSGANMFPSWSPDSTRLAYRTELIGSRVHALGIRDLAARSEQIVPAAMAWIEWPRWSPDGTRLLVRGRDTSGRYGFFVVNVATGRTTAAKLVDRNDEDTLGSAQWDRSGDGIIYCSSKPEGFVRLDLADGREQPLAILERGTSVQVLPDPGFSIASSGRIAFVKHSRGTSSSIALLGRDGAVEDLLINTPGEVFAGIAWMPDEASLLFTRTKTDSSLTDQERWPAVWRLEVSTRNLHPLGLAKRRLRNIAVSPDGRRLAFTTGAPTREPWILEHFLESKASAAVR